MTVATLAEDRVATAAVPQIQRWEKPQLAVPYLVTDESESFGSVARARIRQVADPSTFLASRRS